MHDIEQTVKVYLEFRQGEWHIDPLTLLPGELDGLDGGAMCDHDGDNDGECQRLIDEANAMRLPDAESLARMLREALQG
jgi:hypothetical protein